MEAETSGAEGRWKCASTEQETEDREASSLEGAIADSVGSAQGFDERQSTCAWTHARLSSRRAIFGTTAVIISRIWYRTTELCKTTAETTTTGLQRTAARSRRAGSTSLPTTHGFASSTKRWRQDPHKVRAADLF